MKKATILFIGAFALATSAFGQKSMTALNATVIESFDGYLGLGFASTPNAGQLDSDDFRVTGLSDGPCNHGDDCPTGAGYSDYGRGVSSGDAQLAGGLYAFDRGGGNMAMGWQAKSSDFTPGELIIRYKNDAGRDIEEIDVSYEVWSLNSDAGSHRLSFSYAAGACNAQPAAYTDLAHLDFTSSETEDASPVWGMVHRGANISFATPIADGECFYARYVGDAATRAANQDETALDNIMVTASATGKGITSMGVSVVESFDGYDGSGLSPTPGLGWLDSDEFAIAGMDETAAGTDGRCDFGMSCPDLGGGEPAGTDFSRGMSEGNENLSGGLYSFDRDNQAAGENPSFGWQAKGSDMTPGTITVKYQNATGSSINEVDFAYDLWYLNSEIGQHQVNFGYSSGDCAADYMTLVYTVIASFQVITPELPDAVPEWTVVNRSQTESLASEIPDGDCLYVQFMTDAKKKPANQDEVAFDDLTITAFQSLAVDLSGFTGRVAEDNVLLQWTTASEEGATRFDVQRRADGTWRSLGTVEASGKGSAYSFRATDQQAGLQAYRLKMVDADGSIRYSQTIEVTVEIADTYEVSAPYPNPTRGDATLELTVAETQDVTVRLYDVLGRVVRTLHEGAVTAQDALPIVFETDDLPAGMYFVRVAGERFASSRPITVAR